MELGRVPAPVGERVALHDTPQLDVAAQDHGDLEAEVPGDALLEVRADLGGSRGRAEHDVAALHVGPHPLERQGAQRPAQVRHGDARVCADVDAPEERHVGRHRTPRRPGRAPRRTPGSSSAIGVGRGGPDGPWPGKVPDPRARPGRHPPHPCPTGRARPRPTRFGPRAAGSGM